MTTPEQKPLKSRIERLPDDPAFPLGRWRLTINRSEWLPGRVSDHLGVAAQLFSERAERGCCLGLLCLASGTTHDVTDGNSYPSSPTLASMPPGPLRDRLGALLIALSEPGTAFWVREAAKLNDDRKPTQEETEARLIAHFAKKGFELVFEGDLYPRTKPPL